MEATAFVSQISAPTIPVPVSQIDSQKAKKYRNKKRREQKKKAAVSEQPPKPDLSVVKQRMKALLKEKAANRKPGAAADAKVSAEEAHLNKLRAECAGLNVEQLDHNIEYLQKNFGSKAASLLRRVKGELFPQLLQ